MIEEYCEDKEFVIYKDVIELFSNILEVNVRKILKQGESKYLYGVVGKIDDKEISRITNRNQAIKVLEKCRKLYEKNNGKFSEGEGMLFAEELLHQLKEKENKCLYMIINV
jgi:aspartyl/asparaginyl-tRNA synthetase